MKINNIIKGKFIERKNRFIINFEDTNKNRYDAHLKDPGRLQELLYPNAKLFLKKVETTTKRKTKFDVIAVIKNDLIVIINSGIHNKLAKEIIEKNIIPELKNYEIEKQEYTFGNSRLDFLLRNKRKNKKMLLEIKGCTLVENHLAKFPDAPTNRGKRHLEELLIGQNKGYETSVMFLILKEDAEKFTANNITDPEFSETLHKCYLNNVNIIPFVFKIRIENNNIIINPLKQIKYDYYNMKWI